MKIEFIKISLTKRDARFTIIERGDLKIRFNASKENFNKEFMTLASFACNNKLKIIRGEKMLRSTQHTIRKNILLPIFKYEIQSQYPLVPSIC